MKGKFQRLKLKEATFGKKYQLTREVTDTLDVERLVACLLYSHSIGCDEMSVECLLRRRYMNDENEHLLPISPTSPA